MKTRKRLALALSLAAVVAVGTFVAAGRMPAGAQGPKPKADEQPATGRRAEYIAAFNRGDARAVAAFWTEDATYVDQAGRAYEGRAAIEKLFEQGFAARKGATLAIHVTSSKVLSPDVALEDGITEVTPPGGGLAAVARFSAVLVRRDGQWYVQSIRESVAHPPSNAEHLEGLAWLIGEWEGEAEKGESARAWYEWAENENFIVSSYATTLDGEPVVGGTQWIGWDAVEKKVRSWTFYSRGGFGEAVWTRDGDTWTLKVAAQTGDGRKVSATNVVTKKDDDHLTWQMTELTVDGESRPAPEPVRMKRVTPAQP